MKHVKKPYIVNEEVLAVHVRDMAAAGLGRQQILERVVAEHSCFSEPLRPAAARELVFAFALEETPEAREGFSFLLERMEDHEIVSALGELGVHVFGSVGLLQGWLETWLPKKEEKEGC